MKKKIILFPFIAAILYVTLSSNATGPGHTSGRDATGAIGAAGCTGAGCHSATANTGIQLNVEIDSAGTPVTSYYAGQTYSITITGVNNTTNVLPKFGFQMEVVKLAGAGTASAVNAGTIATTGLPAFCQNTTLGSRHLVEHANRLSPASGTGATGTVYTETISWTAPATSGTGSIKIFSTLNAVNFDLNTSGDAWNNISVLLPESLPPITGKNSLCKGDTVEMSDMATGGTWSSTAPSIASVNPVNGVVTGIQQGTTNIVYTVGLTSDTLAISVFAPPSPIDGNIAMCTVGSMITLTDTAIGGLWSGGTIDMATINYLSGQVTSGYIAGNTTVTYSTGCGTDATATITVNPPSAPIQGNTPLCTGGPSITLVDSTQGGIWEGGTWIGGTSSLVTIDPITGICTPGSTAGTTILTYTSICGTQVFTEITVNAAPADINDNTPLCANSSSIVVSNSSVGGIWFGGTPGMATIDSFSGTVTPGSTTGMTSITYSNGCGSDVTAIVTVNTIPSVGTIGGVSTLCEGTNIHLTDPTSGGTWSTTNTFGAPVTSSGYVFGVHAGTATISYTLTNACGSNASTHDVTVNPLPNPGTISGSAVGVCAGMTTTFADMVLGGTWSFNTPSIATIDAGTGIMTPTVAGVGTITYTVTNGCGNNIAVKTITINPAMLPGEISGDSSICVLGGGTLSETIPGGVWSSSNISVLAIDGTGGIMAGLAPGTATITYTQTSDCGSVFVTKSVTVNPLATVGTISGPDFVCDGAVITLTDTASGGSWSSSNFTIASVDAASGVVIGIAGGSVILSYNVANGCGINSATYLITVNPLPNIGAVTGGNALCLGGTLELADTTANGKWSSSDIAVFSIDSVSGVASSVSLGSAIVSYTVFNSCGSSVVTANISVITVPTDVTFSSPETICEGVSATLTGTPSGGSWYTLNSNADVLGDILTGYSAGNDSIYYQYSNGCGSMTASLQITVNPIPDAGTITGTDSVCVGSTLTLTDASLGGVWTSGSGYTSITGPGSLVAVSSGVDSIVYTVSNSCGTATTYMLLTVNPAPIAGIIISGSGVFEDCVNATLNLMESTAGGVWTISNENALIDAVGAVYGLAAGTDTVTYTVTNSCGSANITKTITINPLPVMATISGSDSVCAGSSLSLSASMTGGLWSVTDVTLATVDTAGLVSATAAGPDTVVYATSNNCGIARATFLVHILTLPDAGTISIPDTICSGTSITLSNSVAGGVWSDTNSLAATITGNLLTGIGGNDVIKYTTHNMCGDNYTQQSLFVIPLPDPGVIIGPHAVCTGGNITLTESVPGGSWYSPHPTIADVSITGVVTGMSAGVDSIFYTVTDNCGANVSTGIAFQVDTIVIPAINGNTLVCNGGAYYKDTLTGIPGGGAWSTSVATDSVNATGIFYGNTTGSVTISYALTNACGTFISTVNLDVQAMPAPAEIQPLNYNVCIGSATTFSDLTVDGVWSIQNANASLAVTSGNGAVTGVVAGTDILSYTVTNICGATTVTATLTVNPIPVPVVVPTADSMHLQTSAGYSSYQWYNAGTIVTGATDSVLALTDTGRYTVVVTDAAGCSGTSDIFWIGRLAVYDVNNVARDIQVFPNPTSGVLFIKATSPINASLTAVDGKVIQTLSNASHLDISELPAAIYFLRITDPATGLTLRVIRIEKTGL